MMKTINNLQEFDQVINQEQMVVIYFYTKWCPDCFAVKPFLPRLESEFSNALFYQMDRDIDIELARHLNIFGIPSFLIYQKGDEQGRFVSKNRKTYDEVKQFILDTLKG